MRRLLTPAIVLVLAFPTVVSAGIGTAEGTDEVNSIRPALAGEVHQTASESLEHDLELVAEAHGWTIEQARAKHDSAERVGAIADAIAAERPEMFLGSSLAADPEAPPTLLIKGPADEWVRGLVGSSGGPVTIDDGQPFSAAELDARRARIGAALLKAGFDTFSVLTPIDRGGEAVVGVAVEGGKALLEADVLATLPSDLRGNVSITLRDNSFVQDLTSFGGMSMRDNPDTTTLCTSGFTVRAIPMGAYGISTAGHCANASLDRINHPGDALHTLTYVAEHRGEFGDFQWHTTNVGDFDDFYASAAMVRDVGSYEHFTNLSVGEDVCFYGRRSDSQDCTLSIQDVSQMCTNNGVQNDRLVMMNNPGVAVQGDSGGPWFFGTKAYGLSKGFCFPDFPNRVTFSSVSRLVEALNVEIVCGFACP